MTLLLALGLLGGLVGGAAAEAPGSRAVRIVMEDGSPLDPALRGTLEELLARIGLRVVDASDADIAVRLAPAPNGIGIGVSRSGQRWAARRLERAETPALEREIVAHVVLGMLEPLAVASRNEAALAPEEPAETGQIEAGGSSTPEPPRVRFRIGAAAGAVLVAPTTPSARVALEGGVLWPRKLAPGLGVTTALAPRARLRRDEVEARLFVASLRLRPHLAPIAARRFALELALPVGADLALLRVGDAPEGATVQPRSVRVNPVIGAAVALRVALGAGLGLGLQLGAELDVTPHRFVIARGARRETLAELARVRPYLLVGLDWTLGRGARREEP